MSGLAAVVDRMQPLSAFAVLDALDEDRFDVEHVVPWRISFFDTLSELRVHASPTFGLVVIIGDCDTPAEYVYA